MTIHCQNCGVEVVPLTDRIERRLGVPATPSELASLFGVSLKQMQGHLSNMRQQKRVKCLERRVPKEGKRGRRYEYLWERA